MAPPSLLEFILVLIVRESLASMSPSLRGSMHLGTKGCICDFTLSIEDAKYKALNGYICHFCREALSNDGLTGIADEMAVVLGRQWYGKTNTPLTPANIVKKLGFDLFTTKGLEVTTWERLKNMLQEESVKSIFFIITSVLVTLLLVYLGLK